MRTRTRILTVAAVLTSVAIGTTAAVAATSSNQVDSGVQIGQSLQFIHGPGSSQGTFLASGAVNDSGTVVSTATLTPIKGSDDGKLVGDETFTGQAGTFTTHFAGVAGPMNAPHEAVRGTFTVTSGTGAYAGLHASGRFRIVVDFGSSSLIRFDDGSLASSS